MITYPHIDPVVLHLGPLQIHWYGVMYAIGFLGGWALALSRARKPHSGWTSQQVSDMLFYDLSRFIHEPWSTLLLWQGGMSFHGGLLGVAMAVYLFARTSKKNFFDIGDFIAPLVPIGLAAGRIGNFINDELWGRPTQLAWGIMFPHGGLISRHPSQLYEFFLEGIVLFTILWIYSSKPRPRKAVSGCFLFFYGLFRFFIEFFREPDAQFGFLAWDWLTMGQLLSLPMILVGMLFLFFAYYPRKTR